MKNIAAKIASATLVGLAGLMLASPAGAQQPIDMKVNVPFSFVAGERIYAPGEYLVRLDQRFHKMELRAAVDTRTVWLPLIPSTTKRKGAAPESGALRFAKYGDAYALRGAWAAGEGDRYELPASKLEIRRAAPRGGASGDAVVAAR